MNVLPFVESLKMLEIRNNLIEKLKITFQVSKLPKITKNSKKSQWTSEVNKYSNIYEFKYV